MRIENVGFVLFVLLLVIAGKKGDAQTFDNVGVQKGVTPAYDSNQWGCGVNFFDYDSDGTDELTFPGFNSSIKIYDKNDNKYVLDSLTLVNDKIQQVLWFDYDNDGDHDLFVTVEFGNNYLYEDTGGFSFQKVSQSQIDLAYTNRTFGVSVADYNKDGYLDIYVANYESNLGTHEDTSRFNQLYRNNGDGTFTNVTTKARVGDGNRESFQGIWFDYNKDGWPDLYVINDVEPANSLYRNNGDGTFTEVSDTFNASVKKHHPMSASAADFDNDQDLDIYMSNTAVNNSSKLDRHGLFLERTKGDTYKEKAEHYGIDIDQWSWGCTWVDYNNNGFNDLYVTTNPLHRTPYHPNYFYENIKADTFHHNQKVFVDDHSSKSYSVAKGDMNNDGFYDLFVQSSLPDTSFLWKNSGNSSNNWLKITLSGTVSNRMAVGSWIKVYEDTNTYVKYTKCGQNYMSQNSQHKIFGLGKNVNFVDSVEVTYLSGHTDKYYNLKTNERYYFEEGDNLSINFDTTLYYCQNDTFEFFIKQFDSIHWNTGDTTANVQFAKPGNYWVYAENKHGVGVYSDTINIKSLDPVSDSVVDVSCHGKSDGKIILNIDSVSLPASYNIDWKGDSLSGTVLNNLDQGKYQYQYSGNAGCQYQKTLKVDMPNALSINTQVTFVDSATDSSGRIDVVVNGGNEPYQYFLNNQKVVPPFKNLSVDTYALKVQDKKGCQISSNVALKVGAVPEISTELIPPTCPDSSDGAIQLLVDTPEDRKFSITWQNGYNGSHLKELREGTYVFQYTDNKSASLKDTIDLNGPRPLSINTELTHRTFNHLGEIVVATKGGTPPYKVYFEGDPVDSIISDLEAGKYLLKVVDANNCYLKKQVVIEDKRVPNIKAKVDSVKCHGKSHGDIELTMDSMFFRSRDFTITWGDGVRGLKRENLKSGKYAFKYRDSLGIVYRDTIHIPKPEPLSFFKSKDQLEDQRDCQINIQIDGGSPPFLIKWDSAYQTNPVENVEEGKHQLLVWDVQGCFLDTVVDVDTEQKPTFEKAIEKVSCAEANDGQASLAIQGANDTNYSIYWENGETGLVAKGLKKGYHPFDIFTKSGCQFKDSVKIPGPFPLNVQKSVANVKDGSLGSIHLIINGGTPPYDILFNEQQGAKVMDSLKAGSYELKIVDQKGCKWFDTVEITDFSSSKAPQSLARQVNFIPNPVHEGKLVKIVSQKANFVDLTIFTKEGKKLSKDLLVNKGEKAKYIKTDCLKAGIYLVKLETKKQFYYGKLVVR